MLYALVRASLAVALRLFYRVDVGRGAQEPKGAVLYVANHPNGLVDPALLLALTRRPLTFLAKAPLFAVPVLGALLRAFNALPVHRQQDGGTSSGSNEGTLAAAAAALGQGQALTLFPEGRSHSEPGLVSLKTGAARIALRAERQGARVRVVPVGLNYAQKQLFRSTVRVEFGAALEVSAFMPADGQDEAQAVRSFTDVLAAGLREVTVHLEAWEDLPLVRTAERIYAWRRAQPPDPARLRAWAAGLPLLRAEEPERFERLRARVNAFARRLELVHAEVDDLGLVYRPGAVLRFAVRNVLLLGGGFPLFLVGLAAFALPFQVPRLAGRVLTRELDMKGTIKFLVASVVAPLWWALLIGLGGYWAGAAGAAVAVAGAPLLALFTRLFLEHWQRVWRDAVVFFTLGNRSQLRSHLNAEAISLAAELDDLTVRYGRPTAP